ncbi:MAG: nucleotidyltransferase domain-containing protein [Spirochaetota bacterium]
MYERHAGDSSGNSSKDNEMISRQLLDEIVRRIVNVANPERIILFGSFARGQMGPGSDLDLLVVKAGVPHRRRLAQEIHLNLFGIGVPIDIVVVTPEDIKDYGDKVGSIIGPALKEGIQIYAS